MKKIYILLLAFMFLLIPNVYGEELNYYIINVYSKESIDDFSVGENDAIGFLTDEEHLLYKTYDDSNKKRKLFNFLFPFHINC